MTALDDPITRYLSHLSLEGLHVFRGTDYTAALRVVHLLKQTSGLADCFATGLVEALRAHQDRRNRVEDVLETIRGQVPFAAPDSGRAQYSDTNCQLLGVLIEAFSQAPLTEVFPTRGFAPLEMADTYVYDDQRPPQIARLDFFHMNSRLPCLWP